MNLTASRSIVAFLSCVLVIVVGVLVFGIAVSWQSVLLLSTRPGTGHTLLYLPGFDNQ